MHIGFDDSEITIENIPHTIIAGVGVNDPGGIEVALAELNTQFGMSSSDEVKWNGMKLVQKDREALSDKLLSLLNEGAMMVTISEGADRQVAAEHTARQLNDFLACHPYRTKEGEQLVMDFDEGILTNGGAYSSFLSANFSPPLSHAECRSVKSHESALVQLADVLAGFNRLLTDISLGRASKEIDVPDDAGFGQPLKFDLLHYICLSQRWSIWGEVPPPPDPENITFDGRWSFKYVGGHGLRIISSISPDLVKKIYDSRIVYMGCMH
jgi:hypothetical protein